MKGLITNRATQFGVATLMLMAAPIAQAVDCTNLAEWDASSVYNGGAQVQQASKAFQAAYWTQGNSPVDFSGPWQQWKLLGDCDGVVVNQPPAVTLDAPANGSSAVVGDVVAMAASASDSDGQIVSVDFLLDGQLISSDTSSPYSANWSAQLGVHQIIVRATDDQGATTDSAAASITVTANTSNQSPTAVISAPGAGSEFTEGVSVTISATAADSDGSIAQVDFYLDQQLLASDTTAPFTTSWTAIAGAHSVYAIAVDNEAATGQSASVSFSVSSDGGGNTALACRPDGLYQTPGTAPNYCAVYDSEGRENMGTDHPRRIIGYFTSWRTGKNGQPAYLASDIPWDKITHINYAFAHVNGNNKVSVGDVTNPENAATGITFPGVAGAEMDPGFNYKGHFNLLNKFKKQHPLVKTLVSVGGWAETGGYFDESGQRVASGGFYTMTTNADGSVNQAGIDTFANSAVDFIRQYGFDGVDIDYEYPTTMNDAGNPDDFTISNARRGGLMGSYAVLMKTLRAKLDAAGEQDNRHYLLTIASPSSGYLLRGMEAMPVTQYLDYVNIMSYDLHGAWNQFVSHNAALYDNGDDPELKAWNYYSTAQYQNIGYLNTDWAVHYFRGTMQAGRINVGIPYYSRGWQGVSGGVNGLGGTASFPDQNQCPPGTGSGNTNDCGYGATGIDNLWHDLDANGKEMGAGSNPIWQILNLEQGISASYLADYGMDPANNPDHQLVGNYQRFYDSVSVAPWLWNAQKQVFLSYEDSESAATKTQYIIDQGIGGIMFWEMAGDYQWNAVKGEYEMGTTLTSQIYDKFKTAAAFGNQRAEIQMPAQQVDVTVAISGFKLGDQNYPINPTLTITNHSANPIPGGAVIEFDVPTAIPDSISDQSGAGLSVISNGSNSAGNNVGGLQNDFHRLAMTLKSYDAIAAGGSKDIVLNYQLPMPVPSNWVIKVGNESFAIKQEHPELTAAELPADGGGTGGGGDTGGGGTGDGTPACADIQVDPTSYNLYPDWPQSDWAGNPNHAAGGDRMRHNNVVYQAQWWTSSEPGSDTSWQSVCNY